MDNRINALSVVLDKDYRDEDVKVIIDAIGMIKGVLNVDTNASDINYLTAYSRLKLKYTEKIIDALQNVT